MNCMCPTCGGIGWERQNTNDCQTWTVCSECENRCNFSRPNEPAYYCDECYGVGWDYTIDPTSGYMVWNECPTCHNRCNMDRPPDMPTRPAVAAGGKSRKRKSKPKRTRKRKSIKK